MNMIMTDADFLKKGYKISADKSLLDFDLIYHYLSAETYWSKGIPRERLKTAIDHSLCFGIYHQNNQAGFARVITDKGTFAYIGDVFVLPAYRGAGLSKWLVQTIKDHPDLQGLRRWILATADAHGLYSQFGFTPLSHPERWMEIFTPYPANAQESRSPDFFRNRPTLF
jgi:N-acetylglutamate synthase-like GNAT family acetyltransferase